MAKYLVFSDSHGRDEKMLDVIKRNKQEIEGIFFLGDSEGGEDRLRNAVTGPVYMVRGNCDWSSNAPACQVFELHGHTVAMTHGHRQQVNFELDGLKYWAMSEGAELVMYGHTHVPFLEKSEGLTILNPGSISRPRQDPHIPTYALLEFAENGEIKIKICNA